MNELPETINDVELGVIPVISKFTKGESLVSANQIIQNKLNAVRGKGTQKSLEMSEDIESIRLDAEETKKRTEELEKKLDQAIDKIIENL